MFKNKLTEMLNHDLQSKLDSIRSTASEIWETPRLQHFTKHGIEHSENIITILDSILGDMSTMKSKLSEHEVFILLAAAYLHDIGMQSAYHAGLPDKPDYDLEDKKTIRDKHHETSAKMIRESVDPGAERKVDCGLQNCTQPNYVHFIALLSKSHRMNKPEISSPKLKNCVLKTPTEIRVRLLVSLLRLADALDRDYMRVDLNELNLWNIPTDSKKYWWVHHYTQGISIKNGKIKIFFRVLIQYKDHLLAIDEIIFRTVIDSVKKQLSEVHDILWNEGVKLYFEQGKPQADDNNYTNETTVQLLSDEVLHYVTGKLLEKSAESLSARTGASYRVDGILKSNDKELKERTLKALSYMANEKYDKAIEEFEDILREYVISPIEKMSVLLNLGNAYYSLSQIDKALENYNAIFELTKEVSEKDALQGKSAALGNIGLIYLDKGDLDNALKYLNDALNILDKFNLIYGRDIIQNAIKSIEKSKKDERD